MNVTDFCLRCGAFDLQKKDKVKTEALAEEINEFSSERRECTMSTRRGCFRVAVCWHSATAKVRAAML
jgi:hypothetical protein